FRPSALGWAARAGVALLPAALVLWFPLTQDGTDVTRFTEAVTFAVIGLSLNVLIGYAGQISLGHQAFVGVGAFTSAYVVSVQRSPFALALLAAVVVGGLQAAALGAVSLRIRGLYFALVTLSYGVMAEATLFNIESLTGGQAGQPAPLPAGFDTPHRYYYLCLALLGAVVWVDVRMMRTKAGRALLAVRENPRVAATFGIDVRLSTLLAFTVSGVFAALGGALYAHNSGFVVSVPFNFRLALVFLIMTTVGGLRSRAGVIVASAFFALLGYLIDRSGLETLVLDAIPGAPDLTKEVAPFVLGPVLLLLTLTVFPGGIGQLLRPVQRWLAGGRFDAPAVAVGEPPAPDARA
ncbi:MAG: branched-chain amino acid ABC transporter permease, partial [Actinomycetota bacterium]|nr:branched-chain amino acid ABC transporter permease [Actinomycetota bacterium]